MTCAYVLCCSFLFFLFRLRQHLFIFQTTALCHKALVCGRGFPACHRLRDGLCCSWQPGMPHPLTVYASLASGYSGTLRGAPALPGDAMEPDEPQTGWGATSANGENGWIEVRVESARCNTFGFLNSQNSYRRDSMNSIDNVKTQVPPSAPPSPPPAPQKGITQWSATS